MRCDRASTLLQLYIDQRLAAQQLAALEGHLDSCASCRHDLDTLLAIRGALIEPEGIAMPADLTGRILSRIAESEARRTQAALAHYRPRWEDARLAALFASAATLLFVLISPALRLAIGEALHGIFPDLAALLLAPGPGSIAWLAWVVWIVAGIGLTLWLAGSEVRGVWRRSLAQRLAHIPQLRQLW